MVVSSDCLDISNPRDVENTPDSRCWGQSNEENIKTSRNSCQRFSELLKGLAGSATHDRRWKKKYLSNAPEKCQRESNTPLSLRASQKKAGLYNSLSTTRTLCQAEKTSDTLKQQRRNFLRFLPPCSRILKELHRTKIRRTMKWYSRKREEKEFLSNAEYCNFLLNSRNQDFSDRTQDTLDSAPYNDL